MNKSARYSPEVREGAVRLVLQHQGEYPSQWAALESIAPKIGCTAETLRKWVRKADRNQGMREGLTTSDRERLKALERENRELKRANEILRKASAYFDGVDAPPDGIAMCQGDDRQEHHGRRGHPCQQLPSSASILQSAYSNCMGPGLMAL